MLSAIHGSSPKPMICVATPDCSQRDGNDLHGGQAFAQEEQSQQHVHDRVEEISQAGGQQLVRHHSMDIDPPVQGVQHRCGEQDQQHLAIGQRAPDSGPLACHGQHEDEEQNAPHDPVSDDFLNPQTVHGVEIERREAPHQEGRSAVDQPA